MEQTGFAGTRPRQLGRPAQGTRMAAVAAGHVFHLLWTKDTRGTGKYHIVKMPPVNNGLSRR